MGMRVAREWTSEMAGTLSSATPEGNPVLGKADVSCYGLLVEQCGLCLLQGRMVVLGGGTFYFERGTPVRARGQGNKRFIRSVAWGTRRARGHSLSLASLLLRKTFVDSNMAAIHPPHPTEARFQLGRRERGSCSTLHDLSPIRLPAASFPAFSPLQRFPGSTAETPLDVIQNDPKASMAFLQNKFRCLPMVGVKRTLRTPQQKRARERHPT